MKILMYGNRPTIKTNVVVGLNQPVYNTQVIEGGSRPVRVTPCYKCGEFVATTTMWIDNDGSQRHPKCLSPERRMEYEGR